MRTPTNERLTHDIDEGPVSRSSGSERRCILSGRRFPREDLVRLAISPPDADGVSRVLPDPAAKAPGRGAWIAPDRQALESALGEGHLKRALLRAFRGARLAIPDDLPALVEAALARSLCERLGLELRAGHIALGSSRIEEQARSGRIALLLHARDSSEDGRKRLDQAWRVGRLEEGSGLRGKVLPLDRAALSVALGRDNVVHLGVSYPRRQEAGGSSPASRVAQAASRLSNYRAGASEVSGARGSSADTAGAPRVGTDEYVKE
ncbi:MAG: DUF448 domain-containing protein [Erythrobacter sp.]|uniref:DUF448 domain-containing protein n=1 Tax=Erythrobacter sp. TaxID=1042 RepID=UPI0032ED25BF